MTSEDKYKYATVTFPGGVWITLSLKNGTIELIDHGEDFSPEFIDPDTQHFVAITGDDVDLFLEAKKETKFSESK